jgi:hypothetical protein
MAEEYTVDIEMLVCVYMDGLSSGVSTTLINTQHMAVSEARNEAAHQIAGATRDPRYLDTVKKVVRARLSNQVMPSTLLRMDRDDG